MAIKPIEILIKAKDEASGIFGSLQSKVAGVGVAIAGYFGISAFVGAVKGAADLQAKLSEVQAVSGATAAEMVLLRNAAEQAGATTKFTATEGADALGNLARAGLSAKDAIATLPAVLNLAQAGNIGLAEASEYVTKAVMGLGLEFADAGRVADVLAKGANASNTSVTGLAQALSYTAPIAKSVGLSLETTVAIIGKFADAGIDASRAGTALNAILSQFADPASKFRQELAGAGITTNNFEKALHELAAAGPAGQKAILAVGTEAGPALRALLNQGMGALDDLKGKLDNAAGSAAATAKVMEDNLQGSFRGLSSAWDTVKNALATPVLPVLKDAVEQLSGAFRNAVSDGTIGKFGEAIATAFQAGIKWAREFLGTVDFAALTARMQDFATQAQDTFTQIGEYATNAGNIVKTVYGVMSAGVNVVMGAVYGIAEAFAGVSSNIQSGLALLMQGLAKVTFGGVSESFKAAAAEVKLSAEATWAVTEAFAKKSEDAFSAATRGAELAREGWAGLTDSTTDAERQAKTSTQAFQILGETLKEVGGDATAAGQKAQAAGILHKEAAEQSRAAVAELKKEYEAAVATGNWQLAAEKIQTLKKAADDAKSGITDLRKKAEEEAALTATAFTNAGIKTKTELKNLADNAEADFKRIKASGQATTEGLQTAFKNYADKAIAANGGVATETIKAKAAMYGLKVEVDSTGKAIVKSMNEGSDALRDHKGNVIETMGAYQKLKAAAYEATSAIGKMRAAEASAMRKDGQHLAGAYLEDQAKWEDKIADGNTAFTAQQKANSGSYQVTTERSIYDNAKGQGLTEAQALQLARDFIRTAGQEGGLVPRPNGENWGTDLQKAIDALVLQNAAQKPGTAAGNTSANTYISNITIPGVGSTTLNFADATSQSASEELLRKLAQAKGASI